MGSAIWLIVKRILGATIPMPVIVIGMALAAWPIAKVFAVDQAIKAYAKQMIAGAEIQALQSELKATGVIAAFQKKRAVEAEKQLSSQLEAQATFLTNMANLRETNQDLQNELDDIASMPEPVACRVDDALIERLRRK
jgi:hypothetical protein